MSIHKKIVSYPLCVTLHTIKISQNYFYLLYGIKFICFNCLVGEKDFLAVIFRGLYEFYNGKYSVSWVCADIF